MKKLLALAIGVATFTFVSAVGGAEPLGRLFFTPAQRNALDAGKSLGKKVPVKPGSTILRLDGVVIRSDADRTIWINGKAYHGGAPEGVQVTTNPASPGSASIWTPDRSSLARVKVGQKVDMNSGQIRESASRRPEDESAAIAQPAASKQVKDLKEPSDSETKHAINSGSGSSDGNKAPVVAR